MPENPEAERAMQLPGFQRDIEGIVSAISKMEKPDDTALGIVNSKELGVDDMDLWQEYKNILLAIENLNLKDGEQKIKKELDALFARAQNFDKNIAMMRKEAVEKDQKSRMAFGGWLNNKNPANAIWNAQRRLDDKGFTNAVKQLKKACESRIKFYAKDGWKDLDVKTLNYVP
jgi:hypothetical protein